MGRVTSRQVSEWIAYRRVELLPDERLELLLASIAALLANQWRGENDEPATPRDFMPWLEQDDDEPPQGPNVDAMVDMLKRVFGAKEVPSDPLHEQAVAIAYRAKELIDQDRQDVSQETYTYPWEP